jgi:hypothetical protein
MKFTDRKRINLTAIIKIYSMWNQSLIVLPKYVGLIDCIDKSKNTKFTGLNTFYVGKQV